MNNEAKPIGEFIESFQEYITDEKADYIQGDTVSYTADWSRTDWGRANHDVANIMDEYVSRGIHHNYIKQPTLSEIIMDLQETLRDYDRKLIKMLEKEKRKPWIR